MADLPEIVYVHNHDCTRAGEQIVMKPEVSNGVFDMPVVRCVEFPRTELALVRIGKPDA
jgi:hypothetical protein